MALGVDSLRTLGADFQSHRGNQRARRREPVTEGIADDIPADLVRCRTIPEPCGEFGVPLPSKGSQAAGHGVMARVTLRRRNAAAARHFRDRRVMDRRTAIHHEGQLDDDA